MLNQATPRDQQRREFTIGPDGSQGIGTGMFHQVSIFAWNCLSQIQGMIILEQEGQYEYRRID
jgi:hypothetical protein